MGERRIGLFFGVWVFVLLAAVFGLVSNVPAVRGSGTIYIRADGSIDPSAAPIRRVGDLYTLTNNIYDSLVVERDNIVVDGAGYTAQGTGSGKGIDLSGRRNATVKNMEIRAFYYGIYLEQSSSNRIFGNKIRGNGYGGIWLIGSSGNNLSTNEMTQNSHGIMLESSDNNFISGHNITKSSWGIKLNKADSNRIVGSNITGNDAYGIELFVSSNNTFSENELTENGQLGIMLSGSSNNNNLDQNKITNNSFGGIRLHSSLKNIVSGNTITGHLYGYGIKLEYSSNYTMSGNNIANNQVGVELEYSSKHNKITGNNITNNKDGIWLWNSSTNFIYHNNFINNEAQELTTIPYLFNNWDNGYPSGGNFWSDYVSVDLNSGPYQNETGPDGIGDTPYVIDDNNLDRYPSMSPWDTVLPTAKAGEDRTVSVGETLDFDASASIDNVAIVSYEWNFGDGTTATGKTTTHPYTIPGTYIVTLTVKDAANNSATDTLTVTVLSPQPQPAEPFPMWIVGAALATIATAAAAALLWRRQKIIQHSQLK